MKVSMGALLLILLPVFAEAFGGHCGLFEAAGLVRIQNGKPTLVLNEGATSELRVTFGTGGTLNSKYEGVAIQAQFSISKKCGFHCEGNLVKVVKVLDPFEKLPIYSPDMAGLKTKANCQ